MTFNKAKGLKHNDIIQVCKTGDYARVLSVVPFPKAQRVYVICANKISGVRTYEHTEIEMYLKCI